MADKEFEYDQFVHAALEAEDNEFKDDDDKRRICEDLYGLRRQSGTGSR